MRLRIASVAIIAVLIVVLLGQEAGRFLIIDSPRKSDVLVVLAGDRNDRRYRRGLELLRQGYGDALLVDSNTDVTEFGRTMASQENDFIQRSAGPLLDRVKVCAIQGDSTNRETEFVRRCLQAGKARDVLLVTSDFHTRRALSTFEKRLPEYGWSVAAACDEAVFGEKWWRHREWAKMALLEWTKLLWWKAVEQWRH